MKSSLVGFKSVVRLLGVPTRFQHAYHVREPLVVPVNSRPDLDFDYLLNPANRDAIAQNIAVRKGSGSIDRLLEVWDRIRSFSFSRSSALGNQPSTSAPEMDQLWNQLYAEAAAIPNLTHPDTPLGAEQNYRIVESLGQRRSQGNMRSAESGCMKAHLMHMDIGQFAGDRSYALLDSVAVLEQALMRYAFHHTIKKRGFRPLTVPDILPAELPRQCGIMQRSLKDILFTLGEEEGSAWCLSGTAEMGIANRLAGTVWDLNDLPLKLVTASRCYRPEIACGRLNSGLYRVHDFLKVEMFMVTADESGEESQEALDLMISAQRDFYLALGLCFRILEMPSEELGLPAYRKFDLEAWLPSREVYGELCSASNCLDFQSRRLSIKYRQPNGQLRYAHTLNATACAVPRTIIAILEQLQSTNRTVPIPDALKPFFHSHLLAPSRKPLLMNYERPHSDYKVLLF